MSGQLRTPGSHGECLRGIKKLERREKKVDEWRDLGWPKVEGGGRGENENMENGPRCSGLLYDPMHHKRDNLSHSADPT